MFEDDEKKKILNRIRRINGQVDAVGRMIESDGDCVDVLMQISAATGALAKVGQIVLENHLKTCVVDAMIKVPDAASLAAIHWLETKLARRCGGSTGTNLIGAFLLMSQMAARSESGSVITLICDPGDRYAHTYYDASWRERNGIDLQPWLACLQHFDATGTWQPPETISCASVQTK